MGSPGTFNDSDPKSLKLPRPLWQIKEELEAHLALEPGIVRGSQAWHDWIAKRDGLKMWVSFAESKLNVWNKS